MLLACALPAASAAALGSEGEPITEPDFSIDLTQGAVLSTSRVTGLAGAATALAEGVEGGLSNPAAVAARSAGSVDFWDYWLAFGVTYPFQNGDFFNSGGYVSDDAESDNFLFLNTGAYLQLFGLGLGVNMEVLQVLVRSGDEAADRAVRLQLVTSHVQAGYLLFDGQLALAGGLQILRQRAVTELADRERRRSDVQTGYGSELGVLIRPNGAHWRVGAGLYSQIKTSYQHTRDANPQLPFVEPEYAVRPWRGNVGFAYQFGKRPLNPRFTYVEEHAREPLRALDARERQARLEHERAMGELRRSDRPDRHAQQAEAQRAYEDQVLLLEAERAAVRKRAWRELRAGLRTDWSRQYLLVAAELSFAGRVTNGVGVESFLAQTVQRSGERVSVTPRIGVESEVWATRLKLRAGCYVEPTRFAESLPRPHGTFGFDLRVFQWDVFRIWPEDYLWQVSGALDVTKDYQAFSLGLGGWY